MAQVLRQSTAIDGRLGPFVDVGDAFTPETGVTIAASDEAEILKANGAASVAMAGALVAITNCDGWYDYTFSITDTDTVGTLDVVMQDDDVYLPVFARFQVITQAAFDAIYAAAAEGPLQGTTAGRTLDIAVTGEVALDFNSTIGTLDAAQFGADFITSAKIADNAFLAVNFAANSLDDKGNWNVGKTGYSLTQTFPANFAALSITVGGLVNITQAAADKVWLTTSRELTGLGFVLDNTDAAWIDANERVDVGRWLGGVIPAQTVAGVPEVDVTIYLGGAAPALVGGRYDASVGAMAANVLTATAIAASALDNKGNWNVGKTGYSLTQAFPSNFAALSITAGGLVNITQTAADKTWITTTRELTGFPDGQIPKIVSGTASAIGTTTTLIDSARTEANDNHWKGQWIWFPSGTAANIGQVRLITGFTAASDTLTFAPALNSATASADGYEILPAGSVDVGQWLGVTPNSLVAGAVDADVSALQNDVITAVSIAASAFDGKGDWNVGKTGYSLTQSFPANFAAFSITAAGLVNITQAAADKVWLTTTRTLTAMGFVLDNTDVGWVDVNDRIDVGQWLGQAVTLSATTLKPEVDMFSVSDDAAAADAVEANIASLDASVASRATPAQVNNEVSDVIKTDTIPELAQGVLPVNPTLYEATMAQHMKLRNGFHVNASQYDVKNDAGIVIFKKLLTDDGTDYDEAKVISGP